MENDKETQFIKKIYRGVLRDEISRADFKREKNAFIAQHFTRESLWVFRPPVFVPALGFCLVLLLLQFPLTKNQVSEPLPRTPALQAPVTHETADIVVETRLEPKPPSEPAEVASEESGAAADVRWARSEVGSVLVFQKQVGDVPITIVWAFTPKEVAGL